MGAGKQLGPNFVSRLLRLLTWGEGQMSLAEPPSEVVPQVYAPDRFGKLDAALAFSDATGVTVSIWEGKPATDTGLDIENVIVSELLLTSGSLDAGSGVLIRRIDGRWYVVGVVCQ